MGKLKAKGSLNVAVDVGWPVKILDGGFSDQSITDAIFQAVSHVGDSVSKESVSTLYTAIKTSTLTNNLPTGSWITGFKDTEIHIRIENADSSFDLIGLDKKILENVEFFNQVVDSMNFLDFINEVKESVNNDVVLEHKAIKKLQDHEFITRFLSFLNILAGSIDSYLGHRDSEFEVFAYSRLQEKVLLLLNVFFAKDQDLAVA